MHGFPCWLEHKSCMALGEVSSFASFLVWLQIFFSTPFFFCQSIYLCSFPLQITEILTHFVSHLRSSRKKTWWPCKPTYIIKTYSKPIHIFCANWIFHSHWWFLFIAPWLLPSWRRTLKCSFCETKKKFCCKLQVCQSSAFWRNSGVFFFDIPLFKTIFHFLGKNWWKKTFSVTATIRRVQRALVNSRWCLGLPECSSSVSAQVWKHRIYTWHVKSDALSHAVGSCAREKPLRTKRRCRDVYLLLLSEILLLYFRFYIFWKIIALFFLRTSGANDRSSADDKYGCTKQNSGLVLD